MNIGSEYGFSSTAQAGRAMRTDSNTKRQILQAATIDRTAASASSSVAISNTAQQLLQSESVYTVATSKGDKAVDFNTFFEPLNGPVALDSIPLLLPTPGNVNALQDHISKLFPDFLEKYGLAEAPAEIKFDQQGQLVLPEEYPHAQTLTAALEQEPSLMKQLRTVNALASHMVAMQESIRFQEEYALASSQSEIDAIIAKYHYLFDGSYRPPEVALTFSKTGQLNITADNDDFL